MKLDPSKLVFIDESGAKTNMTRLYGRCQKSSRLHASAPCCRWTSTTMISSIRSDGSTACMTIEGAMNADIFYIYVRDFLLETLHPGDVVIMDNLSSHKNKRVLELIESVGAEVEFLPAYSPDLNPIELMWSKVKSILRKLEARTPEDLIKAIGTALKKVTHSDAIGWFNHCGYNFI